MSKPEYETILKSLPEKMLEVNQVMVTEKEPTMNTRLQVFEMVYSFVRKNNRILYGGVAMHDLVRHKNKNDYIYDKYTYKDIEFYTDELMKDGISMVSLLGKALPLNARVSLAEAYHPNTLKIYVYGQEMIDITFMPRKLFENFPTYILENKCNYMLPAYIILGSYSILIDPMYQNQMWDKTIRRMHKLLSYYPLQFNALSNKYISPLILNNYIILNFHILCDLSIIVIGHIGLDVLLHRTENSTHLKKYSKHVSILSFDITSDVQKIKERFTSKYTTKAFQSTPFIGHRIEFYIQSQLVLIIYDHANRCIPIVKLTDTERNNIILNIRNRHVDTRNNNVLSDNVQSHNIQFAAYQSLFYFLLSEYWLYRILSKGCKTKCKNIDISGIELKRRYAEADDMLYTLLNAKKQNPTDTQLSILHTTCMGLKYTSSIQAIRTIRIDERKLKKKKLIERYEFSEHLTDAQKKLKIDTYIVDINYGQDVDEHHFVNKYQSPVLRRAALGEIQKKIDTDIIIPKHVKHQTQSRTKNTKTE